MKQRHSLRHLTLCALFAALIAVLSPIAIPIGPVPISLGMLGVLIAATTLAPLYALGAVAAFCALGLCGLPVFSGGGGGIGILLGPTGGYLWSYLLIAPAVSLLCRAVRRGGGGESLGVFLACLSGVAICYLCGVLQYILLTKSNPVTALAICVFPFLPFDIAKSALAVYLSRRL